MGATHCALCKPTLNGIESANPRQQLLIHDVEPSGHRRYFIAQLIVFGHCVTVLMFRCRGNQKWASILTASGGVGLRSVAPARNLDILLPFRNAHGGGGMDVRATIDAMFSKLVGEGRQILGGAG
jgi:hypothetical protein